MAVHPPKKKEKPDEHANQPPPFSESHHRCQAHAPHIAEGRECGLIPAAGQYWRLGYAYNAPV